MAVHRFQTGGLSATVLSDGPLTLPAARRIFKGVEPEAIDGALTEAGIATDAVRVEQNCLLLETGGKRVLFDNGMGTSQLFGTDSGKLLASLAEAGLTAADIDALVLTHGHSDHCWGTMGDDGTPNFPIATLYLAAEELHYWENYKARDPRDVSLAGAQKHLFPMRERIVTVRDGEEFLPGVQAWLTPGHTPGHMAFLIAGNMCVTGDVAFHDPLSFRFPQAASAFDADRQLGIATRRSVLERLADERIGTIGYHAPWPGLGHVDRADGVFRYVAAG